jgi:beta-glucanase (GH16 family)
MRSSVVVAAAICVAVALLFWRADNDGRAAPRGRLILNQGFGGSHLDRSVWGTCYWWRRSGCTIASNNELEAYFPGQVRSRRGVLSLIADRRDSPGQGGRVFPYASGMISSGPRAGSRRPKFAFRYGRAEIRARVPTGKGLWSAFWLLPASRVSKPEIDVFEIYGDQPSVANLHLHFRDHNGREHAPGKEVADSRLRAGWHTFSVDWRPGSLVWRIDGVRRWRVRGRAVPRTKMYLIANLAIAGESSGPPDAATRFPSSFKIDYIRVWR